jgi:hypothetical protein
MIRMIVCLLLVSSPGCLVARVAVTRQYGEPVVIVSVEPKDQEITVIR